MGIFLCCSMFVQRLYDTHHPLQFTRLTVGLTIYIVFVQLSTKNLGEKVHVCAIHH